MRIVVTGGAGFIGSHLSEALVAAGHEVVVIDDLSRGTRENVPTGARLATIDVSTPEVERAIAEFGPGAVFHFAAQMDVRHSVREPVLDANVNVLGSLRVARAAAAAGSNCFVLASTGGAVYGEHDHLPTRESDSTVPACPYGVAKLCAEHYVDYFGRASGMRTVALRFGNVYGARQDPKGEAGVVAIFIAQMLRRDKPTLYGDGRQTRDYLHVGDAVRASLRALDDTRARGPYNIGTGVETDLNTLARLLAKATGYDGELGHGPSRPGEQRRSVLDTSRARAELGWEPQIQLSDGLAQSVAWFRANETISAAT